MYPLLKAVELKKYFKTNYGLLHAVDGVNIQIDKGKTLGVVGESGCGKSTLGRLLVNLLPKTGGKVFFNGEDISNPTRSELFNLRSEMQMIFQDPYSSLNPRMCVRDIIAEPLIIYKKSSSKPELNQMVNDLMDKVGLANRFSDSYPHELDGGRRQRIGVARALALNPQFIVCDEPVSALDVSIQAQILNLLMDLRDDMGLTYVFITHDLSVVKHISDDICVMYLGCVVESCSTSELFHNPLHPYTQALLSAIPTVSTDKRGKQVLLKGELTSPIDPPNACRFAQRCNYSRDLCFKKSPKLEEVNDGHFVACHFVQEINHLNSGDLINNG